MVPVDVNDRLNYFGVKSDQYQPKSEFKRQNNRFPPDPINVTTFTSKDSMTTTQPPMIWFPGSSKCNNQEEDDSGNNIIAQPFLFILQEA